MSDAFRRPVAIITPNYPPSVGGVERYVQRLATGLTAEDIDVEVLVLDGPTDCPRIDVQDGITVRRFPASHGVAGRLPSLAMARWLLAHARRYSLLNAHNLHSIVPAIAAGAARWTGVPLVLTPYWHGSGHTLSRRLLHVPYRPVAMFTARTAAAIVCNSKEEQRLVRISLGVAGRTTVIPAGMDLPVPMVRAASPAETGTEAGGFSGESIILSVGRLEHYKGIEKLVRALPHLPSSYRLVVVGSGPAQAAIEAAGDAVGVSDRITFRGRCSDEELGRWYARAAVCVSLSSNESFGLVVLEAATAGCPVVASDIGAHRELAAFVPLDRIFLVSNESPPARVAAAIATAVRSGRIQRPASPDEDGWRLPTWERLVAEVLKVYVAVARS